MSHARLVDLPRLPSSMRVQSRNIIRSKILADQTLRMMGVEDIEVQDLEKTNAAEENSNPC